MSIYLNFLFQKTCDEGGKICHVKKTRKNEIKMFKKRWSLMTKKGIERERDNPSMTWGFVLLFGFRKKKDWQTRMTILKYWWNDIFVYMNFQDKNIIFKRFLSLMYRYQNSYYIHKNCNISSNFIIDWEKIFHI